MFANTWPNRNEEIDRPLHHWDELGLDGLTESCSRRVEGHKQDSRSQ
jgi:hypothetical protein